jgi:hypothetical protein
MKKFIFYIFLLLSSSTFAQIRGGWNYEAGLESIIGVGDFSEFIPFGLGPIATVEYKFPYSYFSVGGNLGVLFAAEGTEELPPWFIRHHKLTSFKLGLQSKVQLGNSPFALLISPNLFIPLTKSFERYTSNYSFETAFQESGYFSIETSCLAKIDLTPKINTVAKFGIGIISADGKMGYYINVGIMIQGSIGF